MAASYAYDRLCSEGTRVEDYSKGQLALGDDYEWYVGLEMMSREIVIAVQEPGFETLEGKSGGLE